MVSGPLRGKVLLFVLAVDVAAAVGLVLLWPHHVENHRVGMFLLATLVALAGATPVRIPALKTTISATDPFVFTALAAYGPMPAGVVAFAGVLGATLGQARTQKPIQIAFNVGNVLVSIAAAALAYTVTGGQPGAELPAQVWPLVVATTVNFVANTGLVTAIIVLDTGRGYLETWRRSGLWTAVSAYAGLTLSAILLLTLRWTGPSGLALGVPPCWLLAAFYRTHKERQEEQQTRIEQVEELNAQLEDKVADRTRELQQVMQRIEEANDRLQNANDRLVEANRTKNEFLANVSHELRTPLNAIIGFSDLLRDRGFGRLSEQQDEFARDIHESGEHLLRLINDILDLSKIEAGKMEVHLEKTDLAGLSRDAASMLRPQAGLKNLHLRVHCADDVELGMIDPGMYRQVLINLLSNAVKFTPPGGEVRLVVSREAKELVVRVEDTGIGIPPDSLKKIFDEFYQVDGSYSRNYGGTGLGLALVRRMIEMQRGTIDVESTPGEGTRFCVRIPDCLLDETRSSAPAVRRRSSEPAAGGSREATILVVEDNPVNRKLARNVLRSKGYRVLEAVSGEEALSLVERELPDLILMDIQLPGMDGMEVTRKLKEDPATADLPIVALTAHAQQSDEARAREAGCVGYITKPIRLSQFPGQVAAFLAGEAAGEPVIG